MFIQAGIIEYIAFCYDFQKRNSKSSNPFFFQIEQGSTCCCNTSGLDPWMNLNPQKYNIALKRRNPDGRASCACDQRICIKHYCFSPSSRVLYTLETKLTIEDSIRGGSQQRCFTGSEINDGLITTAGRRREGAAAASAAQTRFFTRHQLLMMC